MHNLNWLCFAARDELSLFQEEDVLLAAVVIAEQLSALIALSRHKEIQKMLINAFTIKASKSNE